MLQFTLHSTSAGARRGTLTLNHGQIETPTFMPVGTYGSVKAMSPLELNEIGAQIILGNTFHLWLRPGLDVIQRFGGHVAKVRAMRMAEGGILIGLGVLTLAAPSRSVTK